MQTGTAKVQGNNPKKRIHRKANKLSAYYIDNLDYILGMFQSMFDDFVNINPIYRSVDSARDYARLERRLRNEGLSFISKTLKSYMSDVFNMVELRDASFVGFKTRDGIPVFLGRLYREVKENRLYKEVSFSQIYQICVAFKKLRGPFDEAVLSDRFDKFMKTDEEIGKINFNSEPIKPILDNARKLIETVFVDVELDDSSLKPRPGSGATNTPVDIHMRYKPHVVYTALDDEFDYLETFYSHSWDPVVDAYRYMQLPLVEEACSRFKWIQKYLGEPRGICIEENEMQFFQQGVKTFMYDHLESHPATAGRINFRTQDINRVLAFQASIDGQKATVDMSEASNRVARELVFRCTWNTPIFHQLDAVSTRMLQKPSKARMYTHMFAPMGSGVCFPVMAMIHWALIRSIIKLSSIEDSENLSKQTYVYGDDVIIPTVAAQAVYDYLPLFGMKINEDKSFYKGQFRESCGIHAYNGVDVTPVYVNYVINDNVTTDNTNVLLSLIAKEAGFYQRKMVKTAAYIRKTVQKKFWHIPTVGEFSPILGFKRPGSTNRGVKDFARSVRYVSDEQRCEYSFQTVGPRFETENVFEESCAYLRNLTGPSAPTASKKMPHAKWDMDNVSDIRSFVPIRRALDRKVEQDVESLQIRRVWIHEADLA